MSLSLLERFKLKMHDDFRGRVQVASRAVAGAAPEGPFAKAVAEGDPAAFDTLLGLIVAAPTVDQAAHAPGDDAAIIDAADAHLTSLISTAIKTGEVTRAG